MNDSRFDHLVLTRFNVRGRYYRGDPGDDWLRYRLGLFERFTVRSFAGQSVREFRWLVLIDSESPEWFRERLTAIGEGLFEAVDVNGAFNAAAATHAVAPRVTAPFVLTTRVDNDDAVARDFVETIQRAFVPGDAHFINLVDGAQLSAGKVYRRPYTQNPFITLAEPVGSARPATVFVRRHFETIQYAPVLNVRSGHPLWIQVVHGGNALTELVGLRTRAAAVAPWFDCAIPSADRPLEFSVDFSRGAIRIMRRLASAPHRVVELGRTLAAKPAGRT